MISQGLSWVEGSWPKRYISASTSSRSTLLISSFSSWVNLIPSGSREVDSSSEELSEESFLDAELPRLLVEERSLIGELAFDPLDLVGVFSGDCWLGSWAGISFSGATWSGGVGVVSLFIAGLSASLGELDSLVGEVCASWTSVSRSRIAK